MFIIYDTCVLKDIYRKKLNFKDLTAMWFQKYEVNRKIKTLYNIKFLKRLKKEKIEQKDKNFLLLDKRNYICTYDKELKKILHANKYRIIQKLESLTSTKFLNNDLHLP